MKEKKKYCDIPFRKEFNCPCCGSDKVLFFFEPKHLAIKTKDKKIKAFSFNEFQEQMKPDIEVPVSEPEFDMTIEHYDSFLKINICFVICAKCGNFYCNKYSAKSLVGKKIPEKYRKYFDLEVNKIEK